MTTEEIIRRVQEIEDELSLPAVLVDPLIDPVAQSYLAGHNMAKRLREELEREILADVLKR